ncbi:hypothetical protein LCGC14_0853190 [marine sediment metagenome]|uniref:HTH cro/C1-type domain-containing protein n=1 Tax=marine sediment metagenome TaxID=412755 RepID=A0A0F9PUX2_9ZZZZ
MCCKVIPAEVFHPGVYIKEELEARDWSPDMLAVVMGYPLIKLLEILEGERKVTVSVVAGLTRAFGTSEMFWLNLQRIYDGGGGGAFGS